MKKMVFYLLTAVLGVFLSGCAGSSPEYYEELSETERAALQHAARALALRGSAVPGHLREAFLKLTPYERIVYDGNKHGKAFYRWEIYENRNPGKRIAQRDINPYWVMVYAIGDLRDPAWKLNHANQELSSGRAAAPQQSSPATPGAGRPRQIKQVRYKR